MNIRILIDKLGPITDSEITVKPFMVFTGDSGLGKSYTAFLVYNLTSALTAYRLQEFITQKVKGSHKELDVKFKDFRLWLNTNTSAYIGYLLGYSDFSCQVNYVFDIDDDSPLNVKCLDEDENTNFSRCSINGNIEVFPMHLADNALLMSITLAKYLSNQIFGLYYIMQLFIDLRVNFLVKPINSDINKRYDDLLKTIKCNNPYL